MSTAESTHTPDPVIAGILASYADSHDAAPSCDPAGDPDAWPGKPAPARTADEARGSWLSWMLGSVQGA